MLDAVANTPAPDVRRWRPDLPPELADLLESEGYERYVAKGVS